MGFQMIFCATAIANGKKDFLIFKKSYVFKGQKISEANYVRCSHVIQKINEISA